MIPAEYNFSVYEGSDFSETWTRSGVSSASGWSAKLDIRTKADETSTLYLSLSSGSGITLSSSSGKLVIAVVITSAQTIALGAIPVKTAHYDLKLTKPDSTIEYLLYGEIELIQRVTP